MEVLRRAYIDNYKAFSNFTFEPGGLQLIHGRNGSGKTSFFEALGLLRAFVIEGQRTEQVFPERTRTRWDRRTIQSFEVEVEGNGGRYVYRLEINHDLPARRSWVLSESLKFDGRPLFLDELGEIQLYRDNHSPGSKYSLGGSLSGLGSVPARDVNTKLTWFKEWLDRAYFLQLNPVAMVPESGGDATRLSRDGSNFASWYRHLSLEKAERSAAFADEIGEVLGIDSLILKKVSEDSRMLRAVMPAASGPTPPDALSFGFDELSDGQRLLIVLYTLLHFAVEPGALIAIDDPVNFVAISEVQPFIIALSDRAERAGAQVMIVSHHPEILDYMAPDRVIRFDREATGPVRVRPFTVDTTTGLKASELAERGWDDE